MLEFVAQEMKEFWNQPAVAKTTLMLDYENLPVELFPEKPADQRSVRVDEALIIDALVVRQKRGLSEVEVAVRDFLVAFEYRGVLRLFDRYKAQMAAEGRR